jgi:hypothetical protein
MTPGIFRSLGIGLKYNNVYNYSAELSNENPKKNISPRRAHREKTEIM